MIYDASMYCTTDSLLLYTCLETLINTVTLWSFHHSVILDPYKAGACPGFLKGGSNISWFPKKRSSDFKKGGGPMV